MKVGVDVRLLSRPLTGIGRYTLEMCRALSKVESLTLYLYSPAPICANYSLNLESINVRSGNLSNGLLWQLWSESYLPLWANIDKVDIFWGPAHRLPRWLPNHIARVVTIHDLVWKYAGDTMRPLSRILERHLMPLAVRIADEIVSVSHSTANAVRHEFGINSDRLNVIPLGATLTKNFAPIESLIQIGIDRPYFLFVGTLEPRKNLINLLIAYAKLPKQVKAKSIFVIAGAKGWGGIKLQETINHFKIDKYVKLLGYVDESTLTTLYANAQFLVMPSLYEGFGLPLIEAMVYGTPVLTANNSSMPEVAGNAGLFVDAYDINSISNGLEKLLTNEKLRRKLAANAKINVTRFNWDESAQKLIEVFERAISVRRTHFL